MCKVVTAAPILDQQFFEAFNSFNNHSTGFNGTDELIWQQGVVAGMSGLLTEIDLDTYFATNPLRPSDNTAKVGPTGFAISALVAERRSSHCACIDALAAGINWCHAVPASRAASILERSTLTRSALVSSAFWPRAPSMR
jgi:hypothetical protein